MVNDDGIYLYIDIYNNNLIYDGSGCSRCCTPVTTNLRVSIESIYI